MALARDRSERLQSRLHRRRRHRRNGLLRGAPHLRLIRRFGASEDRFRSSSGWRGHLGARQSPLSILPALHLFHVTRCMSTVTSTGPDRSWTTTLHARVYADGVEAIHHGESVP